MKLLTLISFFVLISSLVFAQPSNDECANAIPLTIGATCSYNAYTNASATASAGVPDPGCANYLGGDVWFSVTLPALGSGHLIIDTWPGVVTDLGMAIYSGNCGSLTLIECDDDDSNNGLMSMIDRTGLAVGTTIYIRCWEYGNNNNGSFSICVYDPGLGACAGVAAITGCGVSQTVTSGAGTGSWNTGICGTGTPGIERVFSFTPTTTAAYYLAVTSAASWMSYSFQAGTCQSAGWTCIGRIGTPGVMGPFNLTAGVTYYFLVDDEDAASSTHIFNIVCPETPGNYQHSTSGLQGTYLGDCMVNTCSGVYTDDGLGGAGYYSNNINSIYRTFCPDVAGNCLSATLSTMDIEPNLASCYDYIIVRNGPTQGSAILWAGCNTLATPNTLLGSFVNPFTSTDPSGCLTFQFASDNVVNRPGWSINLSCSACSATPTNNDCIAATPICGATNMNAASPGPGITSTCSGCNLSENYSSWYYFEITNSGRLFLDIKPEDLFEDYDFALYQATNCTSLGNPVRCTYAMAPTYCNNISDDPGYYISRVRLNGTAPIDNTSTYNTNYHSNYTTTIESTVTVGSTYSLQVTVAGMSGGGPGSVAAVMVWIDWNKSMTFDAGEYYATTDSYGNGTTATFSITVPAGARLGQTAIRIIMNNNVLTSGQACSSVADGEIEDYAIFITDGTHCSNGIKDGDETGVDCGGVDCISCAASNWPTNTGMNSTETDVSEDVTGNSWINGLPVNAGESYYLMVNNWSPNANGFDLLWNFTEGGAMDCSILLPIELLSFDAIVKDKNVELTWMTSSETNNDYFTVLKSYDANIYKPIAKIKGAGNSNLPINYNTLDPEPLNQITYYRLKQTDFDGKFTYSDVRVVNPENNSETLNSLNIYNSNLTQELFVSFNGIPDVDYSYAIYDMTGRPIKNGLITATGSAKGSVVISSSEISQGIYSFVITDNQTVLQQKIIITK